MKENKQVQKESVLIMAAGVSSMFLIMNLALLLFMSYTFKTKLKSDNNLTKKVNKILKPNKPWTVRVFPDENPNAFAIGGRSIYITSGLKKMLDEKESIAVLLHEAGHNENWDVWKRVLSQYPVHFICYTLVVGPLGWASIPLTLLLFILSTNVGSILMNRWIGRAQEIRADDFAIKNGYGKELAGGLSKMEKWVKAQYKNIHCGKACQIDRKIGEMLDEHPPLRKRIEDVLKKADELEKAAKGGFLKLQAAVRKILNVKDADEGENKK